MNFTGFTIAVDIIGLSYDHVPLVQLLSLGHTTFQGLAHLE